MLSKFSVKRPYTVIVAIIIVLILGVVAYLGMQVDLLPSINLPYAVVTTGYTGASPEEVETVVTKPLEQTLATVANMKNIVSISSENSSLVMMEFNQDTDMNAAANEMREKIDLVESFWDDDNISSPMILQLNPNMLPIVIASVDVDGMDDEELSTFIDKTILPKAEAIEGVASVSALGMGENRINVVIDDELIDDINEAIAASINGDIAKARRMLNSARAQIQSAYGELNAAKSQGEAQLNEAQSQLDAGKEALTSSEAELSAAVEALSAQTEALSAEIEKLKQEKAAVEQEIASYENEEDVPAELKEKAAALTQEIAAKEAALNELKAKLEEANGGLSEVRAQLGAVDEQQAQIDAGRKELNDQLSSAKSQLDSGMSQINSQSAQLNSAAAKAKKDADIKEYITKEMISGVLMAQNFGMPAGTIDAKEGSFSVKVGRELTSLEDIGDLYLFEMDIDGVDDIRIKDVARVEVASQSEDGYAKVNGNNGILLSFEKQSDYSTSEVSRNIQKTMASLEEENEGMHYYAFMDQGEYVRLIINSVLQNLLIGALLAVIVLALFLRDYRPTLIVVVSIPASLLFAMVMMYFTGVTMNLISMSGLALGVGMLVDNSIVVIENIYRLRREGMNAIRAAVVGAKEISGAIIASTLTTISVFVPIAFTDGMSKELFLDMGMTIGFSLIASLIVALTVVPSIGSRVLKKDRDTDTRFIGSLQRSYEKAAAKVLARPALTVIFICALLVLSIVLSVSRGISFMPDYASTELTATLTTEEEDMSDADFYAAADDVTEKLLSVEGVEAVGAMGGQSGSLIGLGNGGQSVSMYVVLDKQHAVKGDELEARLTDTAAAHDCMISVDSGSDMSSYIGGLGVTLTVKGENLEELAAFTKQLGEDLAGIKGIADVRSDMEHPTEQLMITVDKDKAMKEGLTVAQIYQAVAADIAGDGPASTLTMNGSDYSIYVLEGGEKRSIEELKEIEIETEKDEKKDKIEVGDVAELSVEDSPASIYRDNQQRYMTITAEVEDGAITSNVTRDVEKYIDGYDIPAGITVDVGGESVAVGEYVTDLVKAIALALVLMYLIMVAQFQSLRSPFIVMFTVPLAFTGGFLAIFLCGFDVSVVALLGFLVLSGVVVNNGIVLVDYINRLRKSGMELKEALITAGKVRLRPILMTALTTILAMSTMALGFGEGMEMVQPMAVVAIGGLLYATLMTLFFIPVIYYLMHRPRKKGQRERGRGLSDEAFEAIIAGEIDAPVEDLVAGEPPESPAGSSLDEQLEEESDAPIENQPDEEITEVADGEGSGENDPLLQS